MSTERTASFIDDNDKDKEKSTPKVKTGTRSTLHGPGGSAAAGMISGFQMKAIASKWRKKISLRQEKLSVAGSDASYSQLQTGSLQGEQEQEMSPHMLRIIALKSIVLHPFSLFMLAFPLGILSPTMGWGSDATFWLNMCAMIPLAKFLGDATEELADAINNDTLSGLLNATLGNAVEMIITVQTLRKGFLRVVKATLLGSILSNLLLVLGSSFLLGGLSASRHSRGRYHVIHTPDDDDDGVLESADSYCETPVKIVKHTSCITMEKEQLFSVKGALVNIAMQLLSIMTVALPTVLGSFAQGLDKKESVQAKELLISRCGALVIVSSYIAYIIFHLVTHKEMLAKDERNIEADDEDDDKDDEAKLGATGAFMFMVVVTLMISVSSEFLVEAMGEVVAAASLPSQFIGVILLPFAGNACEHASALRFAMIDRPGLSIGIAVGSSTQISLFVIPFAVLCGWALDKPMDLDFGVEDLTVLFLSALVVLALVLDGRSNWLKGFLLVNAYIFIGLLYWCV
jgi:Ca2+:H+ antiporter